MIQLFMKRSGSPVIVPLNLPASHDAMTEAASQLVEASRAGKTEIVEIKSVIANLPSYLSGLDPDSRTQLAQLNQLSSIIAKMDSRERNIYAGALDGNSINDLNDMIRVAEQVSDYILIPNVNSDVTLGRYVAVAGQIQGDPRFPEAAWPYLDFAKIGAEYYAEHGGAYTYAGYVLRKQDDELVREKKSKIQLDLSSSQVQVSICLPATKEELERVKRTLGIDCFAEAAVTKVSFSVPYMDEHIPTTGVCVEDANELAWAIEGMQCEDGELLKYLSVLSVEQPGTMQEALRCAMNLDDYYKLKHHGEPILMGMITSLQAIRNRRMLWSLDVIELNKQISDLTSQNQMLATLKQQGLIDPDIFISQSNELTEQLRAVKLKKERLLAVDGDNTISQTRELMEILDDGPDFLDSFDAELFGELVETIIVESNERIRFRLKNGLELSETIERTVR